MRFPEAHWYPVQESREVGHKPLGVERLGRRLVFWRDANGQPHAHLDRCPHLGAALSKGRISDDRLTSVSRLRVRWRGTMPPYSGYSGNGRRWQDSQRHVAHQLSAAQNTRTDLAMVGGANPRRLIPSFPQLESGWRYGTVVVHYTRAIENQL